MIVMERNNTLWILISVSETMIPLFPTVSLKSSDCCSSEATAFFAYVHSQRLFFILLCYCRYNAKVGKHWAPSSSLCQGGCGSLWAGGYPSSI